MCPTRRCAAVTIHFHRRFTLAQYCRLVLGLIDRGIRRIALFNPTGKGRTKAEVSQGSREILAVFQETYPRAAVLQAKARSGRS